VDPTGATLTVTVAGEDPAMAYDWTRFRRVVYVAVPIDTAWLLWATSVGLREWWLAEAVFTRADGLARREDDPAATGDTCAWAWFERTAVTGTVVEAIPAKSFAFSFGGGVTVTVRFDEVLGRTRVDLQQTGMPDDEDGRLVHLDTRAAWTFFLANFKAVAEGGPDLRERDPRERDLVNV
jgi:hypothetical protein